MRKTQPSKGLRSGQSVRDQRGHVRGADLIDRTVDPVFLQRVQNGGPVVPAAGERACDRLGGERGEEIAPDGRTADHAALHVQPEREFAAWEAACAFKIEARILAVDRVPCGEFLLRQLVDARVVLRSDGIACAADARRYSSRGRARI